MLIGIDASRANRSHKSGTEWYAFYLIRHLAQLDSDNQYILYTDKPLTDGLADLTSADLSVNVGVTYDKDGFQVIKSYHNNFKAKVVAWPFRFFWTLGGLSLEMLFRSPEVLFVPAHTLPLIHPARSVVTIHDIGFKRQAALYAKDKIGYKSSFVKALVKLITLGKHEASQFDYLDWSTRFALKEAKQIITISDFSKQELIEVYQAKAKKISVIHNGYNEDLYQRLSDESAAKQTLADNGISQPFIFYIGRLEKKKNISTLIEAFALLKHNHPEIKHKLVLVGTASYGFDEIKYNISEYNLEREVMMTGWIDEKSIPDIYNLAEAFVFPSNYEGFGIPLLQAMACGTPIVASDIAPVREVVGEAALLFDPSDAQDMADKIHSLLSSKDLRDQLSAQGLERVKDFNWRKCAEETLKVLLNK